MLFILWEGSYYNPVHCLTIACYHYYYYYYYYYSAIGKHLLEAHGSKNLLKESQFRVLRKCQGKFNCLVFEMLWIKNLKPNLNIQTDSTRAKFFV